MKRIFTLLVALMMLTPAMIFAKDDSTKKAKVFVHSNVKVIHKDSSGNVVKKTESYSNTLDGAIAAIDSILGTNNSDSLKHLIKDPFDFAFDFKNGHGNIIDIVGGLTTILMIFILIIPAIIIILIIGVSAWRSYNRNKLIREIIASGQDVPEFLLKKDYNRKGITNIALGLGLALFFGIATEDCIFGIGIGSIAICIGIGQLIAHKMSNKNINNNTPQKSE